ncbi:MAG: OmpA family protein [Bacteroidota bacterium]|nr:OmpA family protein [Bacteroidota bacterium]
MKKFFGSFIILLALSNVALGQKLQVSLADQYFQDFRFLAAAQVYEKIYIAEPNNYTVAEKLVQCYTKLNNPVKAEYWLEKSMGADPENSRYYINYATTLAANNKHKEAKLWLAKAYKLNPEKETLRWIESYNNFDQFYGDSTQYKITIASFNSQQSDFSPAFFKESLVFCSARDNGKIAKFKYDFNDTWYTDLYMVKDSASSPKLFNNKLNSRYHEGPMAFNESFDTIYFTRNHISGKGKFSNEGVNKLKIYYAAIKDGKCGNIIDFPLNNSEFSVGHPTFVHKNLMIFASDMPGGFGGTDLYRTMKVNGIWHPPVNLGPKINTSGNELFPFVENAILYFSSNGHPGLGGLDVFHTTADGNNPVMNIGYPINSNNDDFGFIIRKNEGYFSSNRNGNPNNDNIYSFTFINSQPLYILAKNENGKIVPDVNLLVINGKLENNFSLADKALSFNWDFKAVEKMKFVKTGFIDQEINFDIKKIQQLKKEDTLIVTLIKKEEPKVAEIMVPNAAPALFKNTLIGQIIELDIKYDVNKANINLEAAEKLDILIQFMKNNPGIKVELGSHSDNRGSADLNQKLSQKRAESAVAYIQSKGIEEERLIAIGYGKNQLKIKEAKIEEEHRQNRRTTIKIIELTK